MLVPIPIIEPAPDSEDENVMEDVDQQQEPEVQFNQFRINNDAINRILLNPRWADKRICVVSVAGAFRTGKSFILNFFLRYLGWRCKSNKNEASNTEDWLDMDKQLVGFSWRGGDDRDTNGILFWPELFLMVDRNGEEFFVLLMDTQGIFDSVSTFKSCATVFALSTMISSIQVYNIKNPIQEDHLQHLQLFTEYARLALEKENNAFQVCGKYGYITFLSGAQLRTEHCRCRANAMRVFQSAKTMDGPELVANFAMRLEAEIQEAFKSFERSNAKKQLLTMCAEGMILCAIAALRSRGAARPPL